METHFNGLHILFMHAFSFGCTYVGSYMQCRKRMRKRNVSNQLKKLYNFFNLSYFRAKKHHNCRETTDCLLYDNAPLTSKQRNKNCPLSHSKKSMLLTQSNADSQNQKKWKNNLKNIITFSVPTFLRGTICQLIFPLNLPTRAIFPKNWNAKNECFGKLLSWTVFAQYLFSCGCNIMSPLVWSWNSMNYLTLL